MNGSPGPELLRTKPGTSQRVENLLLLQVQILLIKEVVPHQTLLPQSQRLVSQPTPAQNLFQAIKPHQVLQSL